MTPKKQYLIDACLPVKQTLRQTVLNNWKVVDGILKQLNDLENSLKHNTTVDDRQPLIELIQGTEKFKESLDEAVNSFS